MMKPSGIAIFEKERLRDWGKCDRQANLRLV